MTPSDMGGSPGTPSPATRACRQGRQGIITDTAQSILHRPLISPPINSHPCKAERTSPHNLGDGLPVVGSEPSFCVSVWTRQSSEASAGDCTPPSALWHTTATANKGNCQDGGCGLMGEGKKHKIQNKSKMSTSFIFFGCLLILLHYFTEKQQLKTRYNYCFIPQTYL